MKTWRLKKVNDFHKVNILGVGTPTQILILNSVVQIQCTSIFNSDKSLPWAMSWYFEKFQNSSRASFYK